MERSKIADTAVTFLSSRGYLLQTQTNNVLVLQTEKRELNWVILIVLCCLGLIPAIAYYFIFAPRHQVTISMSGEGADMNVIVTGNTDNAKRDASELSALLR